MKEIGFIKICKYKMSPGWRVLGGCFENIGRLLLPIAMMVRHVRLTRRHPGVAGPVLRARPPGGGVSFSRGPIYRDHPSLVHKVGGRGGSRPQKGQNTVYSGRPSYVGQCRESPRLPVTKYAQ